MLGFKRQDEDVAVGAYDKNARQQVLAVLLATALSLIIHGYLLVHFPNMRFDVLKTHAVVESPHTIELSEVLYGALAPPDRSEEVYTADASADHAHPGDAVDDFIKNLSGWVDDAPEMRDHTLAGDGAGLASPSATPERSAWEPRQEILQVEKRVVDDDLAMLPRRVISKTPRAADAPDITLPVDRRFAGESLAGPGESFRAARLPVAPIQSRPSGGSLASPDLVVPEDELTIQGAEVAQESKEAVTGGVTALDNFIKIKVYTTEDKRDPDYSYFRIEIDRQNEDILPVLPKDVILMQDCSASMTEQKLYFCRKGLSEALASLGPKDRFNVIGFRDGAESCFKELTPVSATSLSDAQTYIKNMRARGDTDIFRALQDVLKVKPTPGRPLVALVVTDGVPTTGVTDSGSIIAQFSDMNEGRVSVFTMGTVKAANAYLLDLLSYRNKGDSLVVTSGRWGIPDGLKSRVTGMSRPVLSDMQFQFAAASKAEVYPRDIGNLYLDRPLVLYGRIPKAMPRMIFRVVGQAGDHPCDMAFEFNMGDAVKGEREIREEWAWQKAYHLIGEHTRTRQSEVLRELRVLSSEYGISVPYGGIVLPRK